MGIFFTKLFDRFGTRDVKILMVGLDNAGKTSILYKMKLGENIVTIPTIGFNFESVAYKNVQFNVWDVGGQGKIRVLWKYYFEGTKGLIYVVDSNDRERLSEARGELESMMAEDALRDTVFLIFANKQDLPNAVSISEMAEKLGLTTQKRQKWYIHPTCATTGEGLYEGLDWITKNIQ